MSEKRLYDVIDKEEPRGQSVSYQGIPCTARHCCTNLNRLTEENEQLKEENEKLRKQIQNYEKLIANSYVGEEERLDGWVGQYVIWEDELQKYKNKNEMIGDE